MLFASRGSVVPFLYLCFRMNSNRQSRSSRPSRHRSTMNRSLLLSRCYGLRIVPSLAECYLFFKCSVREATHAEQPQEKRQLVGDFLVAMRPTQ